MHKVSCTIANLTLWYWTLSLAQVVLIKQEKVPCLIDNDAHLALDPSDPYAVQTKPHGHGDVHGLLHRSGLAQQWQQQGLQWVCFFQVRTATVRMCCCSSSTIGYARVW
jgi:UDP-sugar pyrophosphorylase